MKHCGLYVESGPESIDQVLVGVGPLPEMRALAANLFMRSCCDMFIRDMETEFVYHRLTFRVPEQVHSTCEPE